MCDTVTTGELALAGYKLTWCVKLLNMGDKVEDAPFPLTEVDKWVLSQTDEEFKYHDWEELREIIGMCGS